MFKHILLPTDGSDLSSEATRQGLQIAYENGANVTFLCVVKPFNAITEMLGTDTPAACEEQARSNGRRILGECERAARSAGVLSESLLRMDEHPYKAIVEAAKGTDLIVMGSHRRKGLSGVLGSQTHKTITHGQTPVLVIR